MCGDDARSSLHPGDRCQLPSGGHRHDGAGVAGPSGAAAAVDVRLALGRGVEVHHEADVVDVDAASGDVGRNDDVGLPAAESAEIPLARSLAEHAVQVDGTDAEGP
jgi:hypothetical protein